jgi:hypothetical protein
MKRLFIILLFAAIAGALCFFMQQPRTLRDSIALKKAIEFLRPDTTSDIRFGRANAQNPRLGVSPTPTIP